jgi:hypothetical protein
MPTATSFTALGRGNGFPFCLTHATEEIIAARQVFPPGHGSAGRQKRLRKDFDSLADAMDVFWNIYDFTIEIKTSVVYGSGTTYQNSLFKARVSGADDWNDEYGFFPPAGNNPSIIPHLRLGFIGEEVTSPDTEDLSIRWEACGGEVTASPDGAYGLTNGDFYGDPMPEATGDYDFPDQNGYFFRPDWYYNTTSNKYCIVFSCSIREVINFEGSTQSYTVSSEDVNDTYENVTLEMFDEEYLLYSDEYISAGNQNDYAMQPSGPIVVTANKFDYS